MVAIFESRLLELLQVEPSVGLQPRLRGHRIHIHPDEIGQLFDAISYSKGGSILRMLEQYLGADDFQNGLNIYLNRHSHANARTRDLWDALGEASGQPVADIMDTWTGQTGYPFLDADIKRDSSGMEVALSQSRFLYENVLDGGQPPQQTWKVPLTIRTASDADPVRRLMETTTETVPVRQP